MYPAPFELHAPCSVFEALSLIRSFGDEAKLLAGGHSLIPMMKLRLAAPAHLIDLSGIAQLRGIHVRDELVIGAMSTHWEVQSSPLVRRINPFLSDVAGQIADAQVRNRGTIGGSLAHADPSADYPAALLALDAKLVCASLRGVRSISVDDWFVDIMTTALREDEILQEVRIPLRGSNFVAGYCKHPHPASRFAMPGVAVAVSVDEGGRCDRARVAVTGAATRATRAFSAENALMGCEMTIEGIGVAADLVASEIDVGAGFQVGPDEMRQLVRVTARRAMEIVINSPG